MENNIGYIQIPSFDETTSSEFKTKFEELQKPNGLVYFEINSLLEARNLTQSFINEFNLGGSNWIGGRVIDEENNFIAQISYNCRVWESDKFPSKEIEI